MLVFTGRIVNFYSIEIFRFNLRPTQFALFIQVHITYYNALGNNVILAEMQPLLNYYSAVHYRYPFMYLRRNEENVTCQKCHTKRG